LPERRDRLAKLSPICPVRTWGKMVAEVRYRRSPRQEDATFSLELAS
jgi:hypothetical protein